MQLQYPECNTSHLCWEGGKWKYDKLNQDKKGYCVVYIDRTKYNCFGYVDYNDTELWVFHNKTDKLYVATHMYTAHKTIN